MGDTGDRFIPDGDSDFASMAEDFARVIARDPKRYLLDAHDSEMLTRAVAAFRAALNETQPSFKRNTVNARAKDEARKQAEAIVRRLGRLILASDQISDPDKVAVHIRPRDPRPPRHGAPTSRPLLRFVGAVHEGGNATSGAHVLQFAQAPDIKGIFRRQRKPRGVVRLELFVDLVPDGQEVPRFPGEFLGGRPWYLRSYTSSPIHVWPPTPPVPMLVVYWARWADAKGNVGPFSATCYARAEGWGGRAATPLLGPMPEVKQLEKDPKYITTITQMRQIEQVTVERLLPDASERGEAAGQIEPSVSAPSSPKQLPMIDAA